MLSAIYVFLGGGVGALSRFGIEFAAEYFKLKPWISITAVNIFGSIGCYLLFYRFNNISNEMNLLIKTGFFGALTTFSTFSLQLGVLAQNGKWTEALLYFLLNVLFGIVILIWIFGNKVV